MVDAEARNEHPGASAEPDDAAVATDPGATTGWGVPVGFLGALPALAPTLLTGCLACAGAGTAAGVAAVGTPSPWWLLATAGAGGAVATLVDRLRCRRCGVQRAAWRTFAVVVVVAAVTYLVSVYVLGPLLVQLFEWVAGSPGGGGEGPTLP